MAADVLRAAVCLDARRTIGRRGHALADVSAALDHAGVGAHAGLERIEVLLTRRRAERLSGSSEARHGHGVVARDARSSAAAAAAHAGIDVRCIAVDAIAVLIDAITDRVGRSGMNRSIVVVAIAGKVSVAITVLVVVALGRAVTRHERHGDKPARRNSRDTFRQRTELRICFDVQRFRAAVRTRGNVCGDEPFAVSASKKHG